MAARAEGSKAQLYLPFRGLSAWFSCSVNPSIIKLWSKKI